MIPIESYWHAGGIRSSLGELANDYNDGMGNKSGLIGRGFGRFVCSLITGFLPTPPPIIGSQPLHSEHVFRSLKKMRVSKKTVS
jgi:hypothetical protein